MSLGELLTGETVAMVAGSSLLSAVAGNLLARKRDTFSVFTTAYEALAKRVSALETKLAEVEAKHAKSEAALDAEQDAHRNTKALLRMAVEYIRTLLGAAERGETLPVPPRDLGVRR